MTAQSDSSPALLTDSTAACPHKAHHMLHCFRTHLSEGDVLTQSLLLSTRQFATLSFCLLYPETCKQNAKSWLTI